MKRWVKVSLWTAGVLAFCFVVSLPMLFWYSLFHAEVYTYDRLTAGQRAALEELIGFTFPEDMTDITCVFAHHWDGPVLEIEAPYSHDAFALYAGLVPVDLDSQAVVDYDHFGSFTPMGAKVEASFETQSQLNREETSGDYGEYIYFYTWSEELDYATFLKAK
ncbi:MAG: hypothetical protein IJ518_03110 [Clostridia bacterium]|nr:hypothetical protein [Clostridia bacterium]